MLGPISRVSNTKITPNPLRPVLEMAETGPGALGDALHAWKPLSGSEGSYKAVLAVASLKQNNGEIVFNGSVAKVTRSNADKVLYPHAQLMYYLW